MTGMPPVKPFRVSGRPRVTTSLGGWGEGGERRKVKMSVTEWKARGRTEEPWVTFCVSSRCSGFSAGLPTFKPEV